MITNAEFAKERAERYHAAMSRLPHARDAELEGLRSILDDLGIRPLTAIADVGAGHGFATRLLLDYLDASGTIYAIDNSPHMLHHLPRHPRVRPLALRLDALHLDAESIDLVVSLSAFHHVTNKKLVLREISRVLCAGCHFVLVDVCDETPVQRFFDSVVKNYCITGHDFDFLDQAWVQMVAQKAGLEYLHTRLMETPWRFDGEDDLVNFVRDLFGLHLHRRTLRDLMETHLPPYHDGPNAALFLPWNLGYHVIRKR